MKRLIPLFPILVLLLNACSAQKITLINASAQSWAGGICCRTGVSYNIQIQSPRSRKYPVPDTLWVAGKSFPMTITEVKTDRNNHNALRVINAKNIEYQISVGVETDNHNMVDPNGPDAKKDIYNPPPGKYRASPCLVTIFWEVPKSAIS